ncbi:hypothetical protein TorRG33x02_241220 [Trema orientale]|uniref:RNase H type-1 domain-containing protein n=1 Tax=Trema orientale TaxID=63057 RepID=A0A2P5DUJ6_TREOI|nr:hypothetical protein TorRG33x02_241220 [Trema orientale]
MGNLLFEFQQVHTISEPRLPQTNKHHLKWEKPNSVELKLNVDATCFAEYCVIGRILGAFDPLMAELQAMGLQFAKDSSQIINIMKSDYYDVVNTVNSHGGRSPSHLIANDIGSLLRDAGDGTCRFFPLSRNRATYSLARFVISCNSDYVRSHETLACIATVVASDSLS